MQQQGCSMELGDLDIKDKKLSRIEVDRVLMLRVSVTEETIPHSQRNLASPSTPVRNKRNGKNIQQRVFASGHPPNY
jgi:hypothetical protein